MIIIGGTRAKREMTLRKSEVNSDPAVSSKETTAELRVFRNGQVTNVVDKFGL